MKKKISLLIAMLLCISMLLASCGGGGGGGYVPPIDPADPDGGRTPEELEQIANAGYAAAIAEWIKYIAYDAPESDADLQLNKLNSSDATSGTTASITNSEGKLLIVTQSKSDTITSVDDGLEYSIQNVTYTVYDSETGKAVLKQNETNYHSGGRPYVYAPDVDFSKHVCYELELLGAGAVIEVAKSVLVLRPLTELEMQSNTVLDPKEFANYVTKTTYSYYDAGGTVLVADLDQSASERDSGALVDIGEFTYAIDKKAGTIIRRFDRGMELPLPGFESSDTRYAYFTQGQYHYMVVEQQMLMTMVGDLYLSTLPGVSIQILDSSYMIVNEYVTDSYATLGYTVLPNGDVYVCEYKQLPADATEYDVLLSGQKMKVLHTVVSATVAGKKTSLDRSFTAQKLYTETMYYVQTPFQSGTRGDFAGYCAMKDGYVLATLQKYEGGILSSDSVIAVLDGEMNIVAELPKILPNQFGYASYQSEDHLILTCVAQLSTSGSTLVYYTADTESGNLELYFRRNPYTGGYGSVEAIEGGYRYRNSIYDYEWNKLYTFGDGESYELVEGKLIRIDSEGNCYFGKIVDDSSFGGDGYDKEPVRVGKVFVRQQFRQGYRTTLKNNLLFSTDGNSVYVYNLNGELLLSYRINETYTVYDKNDPSLYVRYTITRSYAVELGSNGSRVLRITEDPEIDAQNYGSEDDIPNNIAKYIYYTYYILK